MTRPIDIEEAKRLYEAAKVRVSQELSDISEEILDACFCHNSVLFSRQLKEDAQHVADAVKSLGFNVKILSEGDREYIKINPDYVSLKIDGWASKKSEE